MSTLPQSFITPEQYLEIERKAEFRSEYFNGEMFAMPPGNRRHGQLTFRLTALVAQHIRNTCWDAFAGNMRILAPSGLYTYPDLVVACDAPQFLDEELDTLTTPTLLIEVISPKTEGYERSKKASWYREVPSLRELVFVPQDRPHVEVQRRRPDGTWCLDETDGLGGAINLFSIGYTLRLAELYKDVIPAPAASLPC